MEKLTIIFLCVILSNVEAQYSIVDSNILSCCHYCRSEPKHWVSVGGGFKLNRDIDQTELNDPPAYLVADEEIVDVVYEGREYKFNYAGALMKLQYENLNDPEAVISQQYVQIDMAEPKYVGGILTQGGFHEEKLQGLIPYKESWVTQFVLSYSNASDKDYHLYKTETGITQTFSGNTDSTLSKLSSLVPPIIARYVRYHPLLAQNEDGALNEVNVRVTAITCQIDICATTRINCLLTEWSAWSECECGASCSQTRTRSVRRVQSCGGSRCGALKESQTCVPPEPAWKSAVQYGGIALGVVLLIAVIGFVVYKKTHKDRVEVIVVKENDDDDNKNRGPAMHPRPNAPPMGFGPPGPGAMRGPSMPPNFTGFGPRPPFGGPGGPGMRPRFPPPNMGGPPAPPPGGMTGVN